jgi:hypothetical protein
LADYAGHPIDLDKLDPDKMLDAVIASFDGDEAKTCGCDRWSYSLTGRR